MKSKITKECQRKVRLDFFFCFTSSVHGVQHFSESKTEKKKNTTSVKMEINVDVTHLLHRKKNKPPTHLSWNKIHFWNFECAVRMTRKLNHDCKQNTFLVF